MDLEKPTTLWEYRRKKQRMLSPVTRGLIFGSMFLGWMLYCSLYTHSSGINEVETIQDKEQPDGNRDSTLQVDLTFQKTDQALGRYKSIERRKRNVVDSKSSGTDEESSQQFHEAMKNWAEKSKDAGSTGSNEDELSQAEGQNRIVIAEIPKNESLPGIVVPAGMPGGIKGIPASKPNKSSMPCTKPAIDKFPPPLLGHKSRLYGGVLIYILIAIYMFIGLAIICDDYFVPALDRIAEVLNMPPDVAGATFMAAGSSGPELATAVIGVFVAKDDIGISGVIGSAIFNITLVIAVCALAATHDFYLSWWSVIRDCGVYLICIAVLLGTISNEIISWPEATLFLVLYVVYCVAMAFSSKVENAIAHKIPVPQSWRDVQQGGVETDVPSDEKGAHYKNVQSNIAAGSGGGGLVSNGTNGEVDIPLTPTENVELGSSMKKQGDDEPKKFQDPRAKPEPTAGMWAKFKWAIMYPLYTLSALTIPDCRKEAWANSFVLTFLMAIVWISMYSYVMVWMITIIGSTFMIPDTVMGLTFIAAGVSVPDALAGIAVVKEGHGDMAVSNAIGSNVFDILVCLGLPWFIDTAIVHPGSVVRVRSKGLLYSTFSLFATVVFLIAACHFNHWKLDRKFGVILLIWYFIFMSVAAMYELNVFGHLNNPTCSSIYD